MLKLKKVIILVILLSSVLVADGYKVEITKTLDSNAKQTYHPDLILPISWSDTLSSSFEYRSGEKADNRIDGTISINENINHQRFKLNLLDYKLGDTNFNYSFGIGGSKESFDKSQSGLYDTTNIGDTYTNDVEIDVLSIYLKAQTTYRLDFLDIKAYILAVPYSNLDVTQKTIFNGSTSANLSGSSSESQKFNYEIDINFITKTNTFIDVGFLVNYRMLPLKYSLDIGSAQDVLVDIDEKTLRLQASLLFNFEVLNGWLPTLAYSTEERKADGESDKENKVYLGFNTRF